MGKIFVEQGEIKRMSALFGVTRQTVHNALRHATEGERVDRIRAEALRAGGVEKKRRIKILRVEV
jgi:Arc/MetJ family transcription regulator